MTKTLIFFVLPFLLLTGCIRGLVIDNTKPLLFSIEQSFLESDEIAMNEQAIPTLIRLAEGFYRYHPNNPYYLGKLSFLYGAYCFGYIDNTPYDEIEDELADEKKVKVINFYQKSFDYGRRYLKKSVAQFSLKNLKDEKKQKQILKRIQKKHSEGLFWFTFSWAMLIFGSLDDPEKILELDLVMQLTEILIKVNPDYLGGLPLAIPMVYHGGRSEAIGGNFEKAKKLYLNFQQKFGEKSLVADFILFRYVAVEKNDEELFEKQYQKIMDFKIAKKTPLTFINQILKKKAKELYKKKEMFF